MDVRNQPDSYCPRRTERRLFARASEAEEDVKVYICQVKSWLEVYAVQDALAPRLAYAQDVASTGIVPMDVLGCFAVHRKWRPDGVEFQVTSMDSNPAGRRSVPSSVQAFATHGTRTVAAPGFLEDKTYGSANGEAVFGNVKSMLGELKGNADTNRVQNSEIAALQAANPLQATSPLKANQSRKMST